MHDDTVTYGKKADYQAKLAELMAVGTTIREAATALGITENAAYKQTGKPEFKAEVYRLRTEKTESLSGRMLAGGHEASETLRTLCKSEETKPAERIAAAKAILQNVLLLSENAELRRRLDDIEQRLAEADGAD